MLSASLQWRLCLLPLLLLLPATNAATEGDDGTAAAEDNAATLLASGHTAAGAAPARPDALRGMTVLELKQAVIRQFNAKAASLSAATGVAAVDEALSTLSWGSALLTPEEAPLASFSLTSHHSGATLVLETHPSWAERLNAIAFATADANSKGRRKDTSGIRDESDEASNGLAVDATADDAGATREATAAGNAAAVRAAVAKERAATEAYANRVTAEAAERRSQLKYSNTAASRSSSSASSFATSSASSDSDEADDAGGKESSSQGTQTVRERFVKGLRPADRDLVRLAMEARLAKLSVKVPATTAAPVADE